MYVTRNCSDLSFSLLTSFSFHETQPESSRWSWLRRHYTMDRVEPNGNNESVLSMIQARINQVLRARNNQEAFLQYCVRMLTDVNPNIQAILIGFLAKIISDQVINSGIDRFEDLCGTSNYKTSNVSLKFSEAFDKSLVDMVQMTMFMMVYVATLILTSLSSKVLAATLVSLAPFYYFPPLLARAPNFSVIFGTFKVPIFWFLFSCALVFSLLQGFVISGVLFISWKLML